MSSSTSFDCFCNPTTMMTCHAWHHLSMCAVQGRWWHTIPHLIQLYVLSKVYFVNHARLHLTMCAIQWIWWHATPNIVQPWVLSKGNDGMPCTTLFDRLYWTRAMRSCYAWLSSTVCVVQGSWWHAMLDVVWPCVHSKDHHAMTCLT